MDEKTIVAIIIFSIMIGLFILGAYFFRRAKKSAEKLKQNLDQAGGIEKLVGDTVKSLDNIGFYEMHKLEAEREFNEQKRSTKWPEYLYRRDELELKRMEAEIEAIKKGTADDIQKLAMAEKLKREAEMIMEDVRLKKHNVDEEIKESKK